MSQVKRPLANEEESKKEESEEEEEEADAITVEEDGQLIHNLKAEAIEKLHKMDPETAFQQASINWAAFKTNKGLEEKIKSAFPKVHWLSKPEVKTVQSQDDYHEPLNASIHLATLYYKGRYSYEIMEIMFDPLGNFVFFDTGGDGIRGESANKPDQVVKLLKRWTDYRNVKWLSFEEGEAALKKRRKDDDLY